MYCFRNIALITSSSVWGVRYTDTGVVSPYSSLHSATPMHAKCGGVHHPSPAVVSSISPQHPLYTPRLRCMQIWICRQSEDKVTLLHYLFAIYHWNACLMYMITSNLSNNNWTLDSDNNDVFATYLHSLYLSTLTLTTIGGVPMPQSKGEYVFIIVEFVFGLLLFATILGHVANIVTSISAARKEFQGKTDTVTDILFIMNTLHRGLECIVRVLKCYTSIKI